MIVLDTNVLSEPLKPTPSLEVLRWLDAQVPATLFTTAVSLAELLDGIERLPTGRRREGLAAAIGQRVMPIFENRVLAFDLAAAHTWPRLTALARSQGLATGLADSQIAAIASVRGFAVATRDVSPFVALGLPVIDPWTAGG